nr:hypothetical protein Itr_chr08CG14250 [Ipomoea trifida]
MTGHIIPEELTSPEVVMGRTTSHMLIDGISLKAKRSGPSSKCLCFSAVNIIKSCTTTRKISTWWDAKEFSVRTSRCQAIHVSRTKSRAWSHKVRMPVNKISISSLIVKKTMSHFSFCSVINTYAAAQSDLQEHLKVHAVGQSDLQDQLVMLFPFHLEFQLSQKASQMRGQVGFHALQEQEALAEAATLDFALLVFQNNFAVVEDAYQALEQHLAVTGQKHENFEVPYGEDQVDVSETVAAAHRDLAGVNGLGMDQRKAAEAPVVELPEEDVTELERLDVEWRVHHWPLLQNLTLGLNRRERPTSHSPHWHLMCRLRLWEAGHYAFVQKAADNERPAYVVDVAAQSRAEEADHEQLTVECVDVVGPALVLELGLEAEIEQAVEVVPGNEAEIVPGTEPEVGYKLEAGVALAHATGVADIVACLVDKDSTVDKTADKGHIQHTADSIAGTVVGTTVQELPQQLEPESWY